VVTTRPSSATMNEPSEVRASVQVFFVHVLILVETPRAAET
jgi:hypothetical protein